MFSMQRIIRLPISFVATSSSSLVSSFKIPWRGMLATDRLNHNGIIHSQDLFVLAGHRQAYTRQHERWFTTSNGNQDPSVHNSSSSSSSSREVSTGTDSPRIRRANRLTMKLPAHMKQFKCMKCAGFLDGSTMVNGSKRGLGMRQYVLWSDHDIRSHYSRMLEAFGEHSGEVQHVMQDSLTRTFLMKYKMRKKVEIYKKLGGKDLGGYPVPSHNRPLKFQSDQPIALIRCKERKSPCSKDQENLRDSRSKIRKQ